MAVFRVEKTKDYTVMSNYHLRDKNLSLKAKGLLSWMLSNTEGWDYSVAGIVEVMKENRDAINSALAELEDYGYLTRRKVRDGGKFDGMEYLITERPFTENPSTVNPITENPQQINTNKTNTNKRNPLPTVEGASSPEKKKSSYAEILSADDNKYVREALEKFLHYCRGKTYTPKVTTVMEFAKVLRDNAGEDPVLAMAIVDQSIDNGWKALYPLKKYRQQKKATAVSKKWSGETAKDEDGKEIVY